MAVAVANDLSAKMRRVIRHALSDMLDETSLMKALWVWQDMFQLESKTGISDLVERVAKELNLTAKQDVMTKSLFRSRFLSDDELGEDPWEEMQQFRETSGYSPKSAPTLAPVKAAGTRGVERAPAPAPAAAPAHVIVAGYLWKEMIKEASHQNTGHVTALRQYLLKAMPIPGVSTRTEHQIKRFCKQSVELEFNPDATVEELAVLTHQLYVWACEVLGPVLCDKVFSRLVRDAENLPEGRLFSARKLL